MSLWVLLTQLVKTLVVKAIIIEQIHIFEILFYKKIIS